MSSHRKMLNTAQRGSLTAQETLAVIMSFVSDIPFLETRIYLFSEGKIKSKNHHNTRVKKVDGLLSLSKTNSIKRLIEIESFN